MGMKELPDEPVRLMRYTDPDRVPHIIAMTMRTNGTGATFHVCSHWCGKKILGESLLNIGSEQNPVLISRDAEPFTPHTGGGYTDIVNS